MRPVDGVLIVTMIFLLVVQLNLHREPTAVRCLSLLNERWAGKCLTVSTAAMIRGRNRRRRRILALGLYRLGHGNSCVSIGPKNANYVHD